MAKINSPQDVAVDAGGNVYIADFINHRIRKVIAPSLAIDKVSNLGETIKIFPNPANEQFTMTYSGQADHEDVRLLLTDMEGRIVIDEGSATTINVSRLPSGVYILKLCVDNSPPVYRSVSIIH